MIHHHTFFQISALFYKDVDITHVAASDGATVVATGNRHIWVLHEYQRNKLSMRSVFS